VNADVADMSSARHPEATRRAIGLMTAWLDCPDDQPGLLVECLHLHLENHPSGDELAAAVELIMGMTHLCGSLLVLREFDDGIPAARTLQDLALALAEG
jgi:hypothetical protein